MYVPGPTFYGSSPQRDARGAQPSFVVHAAANGWIVTTYERPAPIKISVPSPHAAREHQAKDLTQQLLLTQTMGRVIQEAKEFPDDQEDQSAKLAEQARALVAAMESAAPPASAIGLADYVSATPVVKEHVFETSAKMLAFLAEFVNKC